MNSPDPNPFAIALQAFAAGDMNAARHFLGEALKLEPENPEILNGLCAVTYRLGEFDQALGYIHAAVSIAPETWKFWDQYISIVIASGDNRRAAAICEEAAKHIPGSVDLLNYWGLSLQEIGDFEPAHEKLSAAAEIAPDNVTVLRNLSLVLMKQGRLEDSIEAYSRSTQAVEQNSTAGDDALREQYAGMATDYDTNSLHIAVVERMHRLMQEALSGLGNGKWKVLDCGCGTGMLGTRIAGMTEHLEGIDLSADMVECARTRGLYDTLHIGDMVQRMRELPTRFDAVVCNFAIYHIADLAPFFGAAADLLVSGGALLLSTDPCADAHEIRQTGPNEYAHSRAYLRKLAESVGLQVETMSVMAHRAYPGFWCIFRKP